MVVYFDIETNEIKDWTRLSDLKSIYCFCVAVDDADPIKVDLEVGCNLLKAAKLIVGHNIINFDLPVLTKMVGVEFDAEIVDTLVLSRLLKTNLKEEDVALGLPPDLAGSHSLKSWGARLGMKKLDAPVFDSYSFSLEEYCKQDVRIVRALKDKLYSLNTMSDKALEIETAFAKIVRKQEEAGFCFDQRGAELLHASLRKEMVDIEANMKSLFPPKTIDRVSPKTGRALKQKIQEFNPASRMQIAERLIEKYGWKPKEFTPDGRVKVDESILSELPFPEGQVLSRYLTVQKRLGQLAEGEEAWLKLCVDGRIHGRVNTNGAITGRCTHSKPNLAQVPSEAEYRSLFLPERGYKLVGVDASGLELRCLAHYLGKYDNGDYASQLVNGDIHWTNAIAFGLTDEAQDKNNPEHKKIRDKSKGAIYALIYGAGDDKLGSVLERPNGGREARNSFENRVPAFAVLKKNLTRILNSYGYLKGLDGRPLYPRSPHAALNTLLQSAGAVIMKQACIILWERVNALKIGGVLVNQVASIHDEYQFSVHPAYAEDVGKMAVSSIQAVRGVLGIRCPLDGAYRVGSNWSETH